MPDRIEKVNDLIRDNLAQIINKEVSLKSGVLVSILKVDTSRDLRYCRVFVSVYPEKDKEYAMKTLEKELFPIQGHLNKTLSMKILPRIEFRFDASQQHVSELEHIFEIIRKEKDRN